MALERKPVHNIPPDAIILSEEDALRYQLRILNNWKKSSDVFAYKYGAFFLGAATTMTGIYLNHFFRIKFKLMHYGRVSSYLPITLIPPMLSIAFHHQFVIKNIALRRTECPVCSQIRSSAIQAAIGLGMPLFLAPVTTFSFVHKYATYNLPYITKNPMKVFQILNQKIKPIKSNLFWIFIAHAVLGSVVTYFESDSIIRVNNRLAELEKQLEITG